MLGEPEVFISYSRTPPGPEPGAGAPGGEVARWRERTVARGLLTALQTAVSAKRWHVWRDETAMLPGDTIHHRIDAALLSCGGAVILLDHEAMSRSCWVRWETGVLTWRQRIGMAVRVVPVLIGVRPEDLEGAGYGPARVGDLLAKLVDAGDLDPEDAGFESVLTALAAEIVDGLGELEREPRGPVKTWTDGIASCLPDGDEWIDSLVDELGDRGSRLRLSLKPSRVMARELLAAQRAEFELLLNTLSRFALRNSALLKHLLEPVWLPADAVTGFPTVDDAAEGSRVIAVNAEEPGTGAHVVRRCYPTLGEKRRMVQCIIRAETPDQALADVKRAIDTKWPEGALDTVLATYGSAFAVLSFAAVQTNDVMLVLDALRSDYPKLTLVVMTEPRPGEPFRRLDPDLEPGADDRARDFQTTLDQVLFTG